MKSGVHLYSLCELEKLIQKILPYEYVVVGNYGCPLKSPNCEDIIALKDFLGDDRVLHYISPKLPQGYVLPEFDKITKLLDKGIEITINDLGLFYLLKRDCSNYGVYLGRMLTKTMWDSVWAPRLNKTEKEEVMDYFKQCNFNDDAKIEYFKENGVIGIEVNACAYSEKSLEKISQKGLSIIGYADSKILAVSRSCPIRRLNEARCSELCEKRLSLLPAGENTLMYPPMELHGNAIVQPEKNTYFWNGYTAIIHSFTDD